VLVIILLAVGLCFVPSLGYGEVRMRPDRDPLTVADLVLGKYNWEERLGKWVEEIDGDISLLWLDVDLNTARVDYMMRNPTTFLYVSMFYDQDGARAKGVFPGSIDTKGKVCVLILDNMDVFANKSGTPLLEEFKKRLETIYSFIDHIATDMNTDIVAQFRSGEDIPLGYFYQGEYH